MKKWRWYIVAAVAGIMVAIPIYWEAKTCEARANKRITSFVASSKPYQANPPNEAIQSCRESQGYFCRVLAPANIPNVGLFFIGLGAIVAALLTLKVLSRQAVSMRRQTKILRRSLDALIASERAWVMVDLEKVPGLGAILMHSSASEMRPETGACVRCICSNQGKTPAKIIEKRMHLLIVPATKPLPLIPNLVIKIVDDALEYLRSGESIHKEFSVSTPGSDEIGHTPVIYGVVKYTHLFSEDMKQTTFGYRVTSDDKLERLPEYPKYNENT